MVIIRHMVLVDRATTVIRTAIAIFSLGTMLSSCELPMFGDEKNPTELLITDSEIALAWSCGPSIVSDCSGIVAFELWYRPRSSNEWSMLGSPNDNTFVITQEMLLPGAYEFAVRNITDLGAYSKFHSSTDSTADPSGGWFVRWNPTQSN